MITSGGSVSIGNDDLPKVYITQLNIDRTAQEAIYAPRENRPRWREIDRVTANHAEATVELTMTAAPGAIEILHQMMRQQGGYSFGVRRDEWKCIWCGSIHPIVANFCEQCGGSRGWIM